MSGRQQLRRGALSGSDRVCRNEALHSLAPPKSRATPAEQEGVRPSLLGRVFLP
jgi:hypothetical protein